MDYDFQNYKPMLYPNDKVDIKNVDYNGLMVSTKLDGVRVLITNKGLYGRSLKPIRNKQLQAKYADLCAKLPGNIILDGELWSTKLPCSTISGIVNRKDDEVPRHLQIYLFDMYDYDEPQRSLHGRLTILNHNYYFEKNVHIIAHSEIKNTAELQEYYNDVIAQGYEGVIVKNRNGVYKRGRVTLKSGDAFKLKPYDEMDVTIVAVNERYVNTNESLVNELGHSYKRNTVDAKEPTGIAATLTVKDDKGVEFKCSLKGTEAERREILEKQDYYIGRTAVVESMTHGVKDKPRHPIVLRIK